MKFLVVREVAKELLRGERKAAGSLVTGARVASSGPRTRWPKLGHPLRRETSEGRWYLQKWPSSRSYQVRPILEGKEPRPTLRPQDTPRTGESECFGSVNGHLFLPNRGHHFSPLVAMISPHWWPSNLPTIRAVGSDQVRGLTPLPAVAWASR